MVDILVALYDYLIHMTSIRHPSVFNHLHGRGEITFVTGERYSVATCISIYRHKFRSIDKARGQIVKILHIRRGRESSPFIKMSHLVLAHDLLEAFMCSGADAFRRSQLKLEQKYRKF